MLVVTREIASLFRETIEKIYGADKDWKIDISPATKEEFGDLQTNFAMINAKLCGDNPRNVAAKVVENFVSNTAIEKLEIAGPGFINIYLTSAYYDEKIKNIFTEEYDYSFLDRKGDVVIDFSSPNIAKRMHIGHLRSTIIGDSVCRIYEKLGYHVVRDNHIGDWGTHFGKLMIGYRQWLDRDAYAESPIEELERVYVKFDKEAEVHPELEDMAREELQKLQAGDAENRKLWEEFVEESLKEYNKLYARMGVRFDTYHGESFYHDMMPGVVKELEEKGLAREDDGAKVVFFPEETKLFPCIVQKKDGAFLYSTSDIATIKFRKDTYDLNQIIYLTDERQQDHFKQLFKIVEMLGWNIQAHHIWFGIMRFADGVFSTRKGNVIRLEQLLDEGKKRAYEIVNEKNPTLTEEEKQNIAEKVGVGAIKYADLSQNRQSPIIFEWDKILSFEGNTAPYLQYSYARIQSIMRRARTEGKEITKDGNLCIKDKHEISLARQLSLFPLAILRAADGFRPNVIADYLFELSKKFNSFYNACPILSESDDVLQSRGMLAMATGQILKEGLDLLGIEVLERM